jgi:hypothetical protein
MAQSMRQDAFPAIFGREAARALEHLQRSVTIAGPHARSAVLIEIDRPGPPARRFSLRNDGEEHTTAAKAATAQTTAAVAKRITRSPVTG